MKKSFPLTLLGFAALLTSASTILGESPQMVVTRNNGLVTAHVGLGEVFSGQIDIAGDAVTFGNFTLTIADEGVAERLEAELGEYDIELPVDFGLDGTVSFDVIDTDGTPLGKIDTGKILHDAPGLAEAIARIGILANHNMADGITNHFPEFLAELKQMAEAA